jgi:ABC-type bacteriocin/lantibiotic exporter with double-glycine peptidase domain
VTPGATARAFERSLPRRIGFGTRRVLIVDPKRFDSVALPAIAYWQNRHFVVVERWVRAA